MQIRNSCCCLLVASYLLQLVACGETTNPSSKVNFDYDPPACRETLSGPPLKDHVKEADLQYFERLDSLRVESLPEVYNLSDTLEMDRSVISYMLNKIEVNKKN